MNKVLLAGNLTKDSELKYTTSKKPIVKNSIAVRRDKDNTDFINFTAFGKTAETLCTYTQKGTKILLIGEIRTGSYEKDGKKTYTQDILVSSIELLCKSEKPLETAKNEQIQEEQDLYKEFSEEVEITDADLPF